MKKLLFLLLLPIFASAQVTLPDSTRQTGGTNFSPQFNYNGANASTAKLQIYNPLSGKFFGLYSAYQQSQLFPTFTYFNTITGTSTLARINGKADSTRLYGTVLPNYLLKTDTASLSNRINRKADTSDVVLINGRAGGQLIFGGTVAGDYLQFKTSTNKTPSAVGAFRFGFSASPGGSTSYFSVIDSLFGPTAINQPFQFVNFSPKMTYVTSNSLQTRGIFNFPTVFLNGTTNSAVTGFSAIYSRPVVSGSGSQFVTNALFARGDFINGASAGTFNGLAVESPLVSGGAVLGTHAMVNLSRTTAGTKNVQAFFGTGGSAMPITSTGWALNNYTIFSENTDASYWSGFHGFGTQNPRRFVDILSTSAPQLRTTYTDNSVYTDYQTDANGYTNTVNTGGKWLFTPSGGASTINAASTFEIQQATGTTTSTPVNMVLRSLTDGSSFDLVNPLASYSVYKNDASGGAGTAGQLAWYWRLNDGSQTSGRLSAYGASGLVERLRWDRTGVSLNAANPTSGLDLQVGSTTVAPIRFPTGTVLTTPLNGTVEFDGTRFYGTNGSTRNTFAWVSELSDFAAKSATNTFSGQQTFLTTGNSTAINGSWIAFSESNFATKRPRISFSDAATTRIFNLYAPDALTTSARTQKFQDDDGDIALTKNIPSQLRLTGSGTGAATTISIPHGLSGVTSSSIAIVQPINAASAGVSYITTDATNINIVYTVAPANGTNNLSYNVSIKP